MSEFNEGDKVRVTVIREVTVDEDREAYINTGFFDVNEEVPEGVTVELVERAPYTKDPVGTIRENTGHCEGSYVKFPSGYRPLGGTWEYEDSKYFTVDTMGDIIGAVPGTPADEEANN